MKKSLYIFFAIAALFLNACSHDGGEDILKTVPKNPSYMAVIDTHAIAAKLGNSKLDNSDIEGILSLFNNTGNLSLNPVWEFTLSSDSGVDFDNPIVVFEYKRATVYTFLLKDAGKYRKGLEAKTSAGLQDVKGILSLPNGTVFIKDDQAWISAEYPGLRNEDILRLATLKENESAWSEEYFHDMMEHTSDISWISNVNSILGDDTGLQSSLIINFLFDNASYTAGSVNFEEGKVTGEATVLTSKLQPSRMALTPQTVDVASLCGFKGKGNTFFAIGLDSATVKHLTGQLRNLGLIPPQLLSLLSNIDGTLALVASISEEDEWYNGLSIMATLNSDAAAKSCSDNLSDILGPNESMQISCEENKVYVINTGSIGDEFSARATEFKDADAGLVFNSKGVQGMNPALRGGEIFLKLSEDNVPVINFTFDTTPGKNALLSIIGK